MGIGRNILPLEDMLGQHVDADVEVIGQQPEEARGWYTQRDFCREFVNRLFGRTAIPNLTKDGVQSMNM